MNALAYNCESIFHTGVVLDTLAFKWELSRPAMRSDYRKIFYLCKYTTSAFLGEVFSDVPRWHFSGLLSRLYFTVVCVHNAYICIPICEYICIYMSNIYNVYEFIHTYKNLVVTSQNFHLHIVLTAPALPWQLKSLSSFQDGSNVPLGRHTTHPTLSAVK